MTVWTASIMAAKPQCRGRVEKKRKEHGVHWLHGLNNHRPFLSKVCKIKYFWLLSLHTAPISPTAVSLVMLLVSWPGGQNDEVSREVIPVCSSDYFPNSHLILPTTHQQGARERECGSCSHRAGRRGEDEKKRRDGEDKKRKHRQTNSKHIRGRETTVSVSGRWAEHNDQSCVIRGGYGCSSVLLFPKPFRKTDTVEMMIESVRGTRFYSKNICICIYCDNRGENQTCPLFILYF